MKNRKEGECRTFACTKNETMHSKKLRISAALALCLMGSGLTVMPNLLTDECAVMAETGQESETYSEDDVEELLTYILEKDGINKLGYQVTDYKSDSELQDGDIVYGGGTYYVCVRLDESTYKLLGLSSEGDVYEVEVLDVFQGTTIYHRDKTKPDYIVVKDLRGSKYATLSTISLPVGYEWKNPDEMMKSTGVHKFEAVYKSPNRFLYTDINMKLKVNVEYEPDLEIQDTYYTYFYPFETASDIKLPLHWSWKTPDYAFVVGENVCTAVCTIDDEVVEEKEIKIMVEKGTIGISDVNLTVTKGTTLTNDLLPSYIDGYLTLDNGDIVVTEDGVYTCSFTPYDDRYNGYSDVKVKVKVLPEAKNSTTEEPTTEEPTTENPATENPTTEDPSTTSSTTENSTTESPTTESPSTETPTTETPTTENPTTEASTTEKNLTETPTTEEPTTEKKKEKTTEKYVPDVTTENATTAEEKLVINHSSSKKNTTENNTTESSKEKTNGNKNGSKNADSNKSTGGATEAANAAQTNSSSKEATTAATTEAHPIENIDLVGTTAASTESASTRAEAYKPEDGSTTESGTMEKFEIDTNTEVSTATASDADVETDKATPTQASGISVEKDSNSKFKIVAGVAAGVAVAAGAFFGIKAIRRRRIR